MKDINNTLIVVALICGFILSGLVGYLVGKKNTSAPYKIRQDKIGQNSTTQFIPRSPVTPTPLLGPGIYACDPFGDCADYGDSERKSCPVTFADRNCLGQCSEKTKRCAK